jgi:hypothetical protein
MYNLCRIVVYSPQIIENYQLESGEGLSLLFIYVWLLGDVCNLVGAVMAGLLPTVIILGVYVSYVLLVIYSPDDTFIGQYTLCDTVLLCQVYYYRWKRQTRRHVVPAHIPGEVSEETCLIANNRPADPSERLVPSITRIFVRYLAAVSFVSAAGVAAYCISNWLPNDDISPAVPDTKLDWHVQVIGWTSATAYRVFLSYHVWMPSLTHYSPNSWCPAATNRSVSHTHIASPTVLKFNAVKNFKTRCEGLAPGLFVFSILGNATYALSIIAASRDTDYLIRNASWLAGIYS